MKALVVVLNILAVVLGNQAFANVSTDQPVPIGHCYHWLQSSAGYLDFKYDYAKKNGNELTFFTSPDTSNGSVAGPGLYCAKSPSESFGYGDRVIRIELVDDVVILDANSGKNYCGHNGRYYANDAECQAKDWDIKYYNHSPDWYVIQNPRAVKSWSATSPNVVEDLQEEMRYGGGEYSSHARTAIQAINADVQKNGVREMVNARARMGFAEIINDDKLLRSLPAMTVLGEIVRSENSKIDKSLLAKVLASTVDRVLEDDYLPWADVKPVLKGNKKIKQAFTAGIQKQLAALSGKKSDTQKNFDVMLLFAGQKDSGITPEQIKVLIAETFKNPSNFGQTRFAKGDLSEDLKAGLVAELTRRLAMPGTKNDLGLLASLVTFVSINNIDAKAKSDVTAMYYEFVKSMTASKFFLSDRKNKYPLGDTTQIATQLCQANIAAYNLVNKDLSIGSGEVAVGVGQISSISNSAAFCQQQTSLMDVLAQMPKKGDAKLQTLTGTIGDHKFRFVVIDSESTEAQLRSFLKRNQITTSDSITMSLGKKALQSNYYSLNDEDSIVAIVMSLVNSNGIFPRNQLTGLNAIAEKGQGKSKKVDVTFGDLSTVTFKIDTIEDFNEQCALLAPVLNQNPVAGITMLYKEQEEVLEANSLQDAKLVCAIARQQLFAWKFKSVAVEKSAPQMARLKSGKKRSMDVSFGAYSFVLKVKTLEDLESQCLLLAPMLEDYPAANGSWHINDDDGESYNDYSADPATTTTATTCSDLRNDVMVNTTIPSTKYLAALDQLKAMGKGKRIKAEMTFQELEVEMAFDSIEDFKDQCPLLAPGLQGRQVSRITYTVGDNGYYVDGDYKTPQEMCDGATGLLLDNGVPSRKYSVILGQLSKAATGKPYQMKLNISGTEILFGVNNMEDFATQCKYLGDMFDKRPVYAISYLGENEVPVRIDPSTAIGKTTDLCDYLKEELVNEIPVKTIADVAAKASSSKYSFVAYLFSLPITFALNSESEFANQCKTLVAAAPLDEITAISIQSGPWSSRSIAWSPHANIPQATVCKEIWNHAVLGYIPSAEQKDILSFKRKHMIEAAFNGVPFTFKVDSKDQLIGQCLNLTDSFKEDINEIQYKKKDGKVITISRSDSSMSASCRRLAADFKF